MKKLIIIAAITEKGVIGKDKRIPWKLPNDLQYFKEKTLNCRIVMGRKTFESIGKILPNRENIILSKNKNFKIIGAKVYHSVEKIIKESEKVKTFIIGGEEIYKLFLEEVDILYITLIKQDIKGDSFFPKIDMNKWNLVSSQKGEKNEKNNYDYYFLKYKRK
ncbi:MAG: hypothetical protein B6I28_04880 [Fusobacteriia bacterium 4572_132]|nr:MAG: hypothetical protein B6I28_04880 [Fusobacteriia bacterium 4572_132]